MTDPQITMSLVLATIGRTEPINAFLDSLAGQLLEGVEVIVVDQNPDDRVVRLLSARSDAARIVRVFSKPGVSLARNVGVAASTGAILGFPDDDCWYPQGLLNQVQQHFADHPEADGMSCRVSDETGRASAGGYMASHSHWITRSNIWRSVVSPGLFVRRRVHAGVGGFDERLGVGAGTPWGSAEETDYVLRALAHGFRILYQPQVVVIHPRRAERLCAADIQRGWRYGQGVGFTLARNGYGVLDAAYYATLPLASAGLSTLHLEPGKAFARVGMSAGRCVGWCRGRWNRAHLTAPINQHCHVDSMPLEEIEPAGEGLSAR